MRIKTKVGSIAAVAAILAGSLLSAAPASAAGNWWGWTDRSYQTCMIKTAMKASSLSGQGYVITKMRVCAKVYNPQSGTFYLSDIYW